MYNCPRCGNRGRILGYRKEDTHLWMGCDKVNCKYEWDEPVPADYRPPKHWQEEENQKQEEEAEVQIAKDILQNPSKKQNLFSRLTGFLS